jgi:hypothetical protein
MLSQPKEEQQPQKVLPTYEIGNFTPVSSSFPLPEIFWPVDKHIETIEVRQVEKERLHEAARAVVNEMDDDLRERSWQLHCPMSRLPLLDGLLQHLPLDAPNAMSLRDTLGHTPIRDPTDCLCVLLLDLRDPSANLPEHRMSRNIVHHSIGRKALHAPAGQHRCMRRR